MPNVYIRQQCINMTQMVKQFEHACTIAVRKDNGDISRDEEAAIKTIKKANKAYLNHLSKLLG